MNRKNDVPGRLSAATPAAVLGCVLFVAAVVFSTVQAGFAEACYCSPCSYSEFGQSKITSSVRGDPDHCGTLACIVGFTICTPSGCTSDGADCRDLPSNPCSILLCDLK